jgi:hypothetical protein
MVIQGTVLVKKSSGRILLIHLVEVGLVFKSSVVLSLDNGKKKKKKSKAPRKIQRLSGNRKLRECAAL